MQFRVPGFSWLQATLRSDTHSETELNNHGALQQGRIDPYYTDERHNTRLSEKSTSQQDRITPYYSNDQQGTTSREKMTSKEESINQFPLRQGKIRHNPLSAFELSGKIANQQVHCVSNAREQLYNSHFQAI